MLDEALHEQYANEVLEVVWEPSPRQALLITCPVFEILFGGARGGGKSDGVLGEWAVHAQTYGQYANGLVVRRERTQLVDLIERSKVLYNPLKAKFHEQEKLWRFPNGAKLRFAFLESDDDAMVYQGWNLSRVYVEEMGTFPNFAPIQKLLATLRVTVDGVSISKFIATANPGGPGHLWIKQRYIDPDPRGLKIVWSTFKNPFTGEPITKDRVFIPSKIQDNKYTNNNEYIGNLYMAGNEELVKAWLMGDWNVTLGAFFPEFNVDKHVIKSFPIPKHWNRFMSMDWGSATPFSIGWWAVVPDEFDSEVDIPYYDLGGHRITLPSGSVIRYREWYGSLANLITDTNVIKPVNVGLQLPAEDIAAGIAIREAGEPLGANGRARISYRVIDPKAFAEDGGPSPAERMSKPPYHINFQRADNKRVGNAGHIGGWDQLRARLKGVNDRPMIYFMDCCPDAIRTLPAVQHNPDNLEDVEKKGEDHCPDEIRYACMSRPYNRTHVPDVIKRVFKQRDNGLVLHDDMSDIYDPKVDFLNTFRIN